MSLDEMIASDKAFLSPADVAPVLGSHPQYIRVAARKQPELVGFSYTFVGNRMKIPRIPFLRFLGINI